MLKRATKVTSLLVTAASIVSMVPVMAADITKVAGEEGTVYQIKAEPGATYLDAELNGEDEAVYVYKDGKYTKLDGAEPGDTFGDVVSYDGNTYLEMSDGDYYVNVETGESTDEDIKGDIDDDADSVLRKAIRSDNDGRFADSTTDDIVEAETDHGTSKTLYGGATCRRYNYTLDNPFTYDGTYTKTYSAIFSDDKGNYIDGDYNLGNVGVYTTAGGVTIKNTEDTYELVVEEDGEDVTYEIKAEIQNIESFAVDSDYITRTAALSIWGRVSGSEDGFNKNLTQDVYFGSSKNHFKQVTDSYVDNCTSVRVMQRISKAQASDEIDGIKYAKDVKTYFITDDEGEDQPLFGLSDNDNAASDSGGYGWFLGGTQGYIVSQYRDVANKRQYAETVNFKSENGYNYTDIGDADSVDVAYVDSDDSSTYAYAIGCGDNYVLSDDGYIEEFIAKDNSWEKLYKVDGGMNEISISLSMFAAVWNEDDGVYSIITPGALAGDTAAATDTTTTTATTAAATTAGWAKSTDGTWSFVKLDGTKATGWYLDGTVWYYLNATGVMQTGWVNDNGTWYYCNESGAMLANTNVDGYILGASGAWVK